MPQILARITRGEWIDHYETVRRTKGGALVHVSLTVSPVRDASRPIVGASKIVRDITARKEADAALKRQRRETETLAEIAQRLSASLDLDTVLRRVVAGAQELCGCERAFIMLREWARATPARPAR